MAQDWNLPEIYTERRRRLRDLLGEGIALIDASGVSPDPLLHDKNLLYLTGEKRRDSILVLAPGGMTVDRFETLQGPEVGRGREVEEVLFVRALSEREKLIDGDGLSYGQVSAATGVETVRPLDRLQELFGDALMRHQVFWVNAATRPGFDQPLTSGQRLVTRVRDRFPWLRINNAAATIHEMRRTKDAYEVECLRRAFEIHTEVFSRIMATLKPGDNEGLGKAIFDYETAKRAGEGVSGAWNDRYSANVIVAAGPRAAIGHYMDNNRTIDDGDLVLIDAGVEYLGYCSDISRTFPANGRFSDRQRELYRVVLEAEDNAIATMKPGSTNRDAHQAVYETFARHGLEKYGYGTAGHPVGLNIHDANGWRVDDDLPFERGHVLVIEPFLMKTDEGIGIRIEDGVLITDEGCEVLPGPSREIEDVEALCRRNTVSV